MADNAPSPEELPQEPSSEPTDGGEALLLQVPSAPPSSANAAAPPAWIAVDSTNLNAGSASNNQAWMVSFTDLIALLLAFFVLLYAMSHVREPQWQNLVKSLRDDLETVSLVRIFLPRSEFTIKPVETVPGESLDYLVFLLDDQLSKQALLTEAMITRKDDRLIISLPSDLLFAAGNAQPSDTGQAAILSLGSLLGRISNKIEVAGHADPTPPIASYASNWGLSLARAVAVSHILTRSGYADPIIARGHGHSHYQHISDQMTAVQRKALARRVDIIVHKNAVERQE